MKFPEQLEGIEANDVNPDTVATQVKVDLKNIEDDVHAHLEGATMDHSA